MLQQVKEYVKIYPVCQKNKSENTPYLGLLAPLPLPDMAWTHISMDFIEGPPTSKGKNVILVVVYRFTKYSHFIAISHPYTAQDIVDTYIIHVFKLHGLPKVIVTEETPFLQVQPGSQFSRNWVWNSTYHQHIIPKQTARRRELTSAWKIT